MTWLAVEVHRDGFFRWSVWFDDRCYGRRRTQWGAYRLLKNEVVPQLKAEGYESFI